MRQLSRPAVVVWICTVSIGLAALVYALLLLPTTPFNAAAAAVLVLGGAAANFFTLRLPSAREHHRQETTVASALYVSALLLLPAPIAVLVAACAYGIVWALRPRTRPWFKNLFNVCQFIISVGAAGLVWSLAGPIAGAPIPLDRVGWLVLAVIVYFVLNTGLVSWMVAWAQGLPLVHVWTLGNRHTVPAYFGMMFVGVLLASLWVSAPWTVLLAAIPLVTIHFSFKSTVELEEQTLAALFQLAEIIDQRDSYTHKHSLRVGEYAEKIAVELGRAGNQAYLIHLGGRLHDIGKCAVSNEVLLKPGPLTPDERTHMCQHPAAGGLMLQNFAMYQEVARSVRGHHEQFDGSGYPDGLAGERIPLGARVIAVADSYDAMTTTRPYRVALPHEEAVRRLRSGRGTQWDPRVVDAFLTLADRQPLLTRTASPSSSVVPSAT